MWEKKVKKTIFTLAVNNWEPNICDITFPLLKLYADKIGADFYVIKDRKFPEWPITHEKMQIYNMAQEMENDWNIYIDADTLVHPETIDATTLITKDTVAQNGCDDARLRWKYDRFFTRDGRNISSCNWFTIASDLCIDLWHPVDDLTPKECISRCFPTVEETNTVVTSSHLIDDFVLSRNIAKFGLKYVTIAKKLKEGGFENAWFTWHQYTLTPEQKLTEMKKVVQQWKLS
jgi:hypothetical protein